MWTPGMGELIVILVIILVIFGAGKLPQVGKSLGGAISEFRNSIRSDDNDEETSAPKEETKS